jgi:phytoene/squalene synthetase
MIMDLYRDVAFQTSKVVTKNYSTSFYIAVRFLPGELREAIFSIYGFVRLADEIVDTFHHVNQQEMLDRLEKEYYETLHSGLSINPIMHSFAITVKKYGIPNHLVDSFLKSMKADLNKRNYYSVSELNEYIYGSADVVGLMCLMVFVNGNKQLYSELEKSAMKLGSAFQKVNFLRDLKADMEELDRRYFPQFNYHTFDEKVKRELVEDIQNDFREALTGIKRLPGKSKLAVLIAYVYYRQLLKKLQQTPANKVVEERIRVGDSTKMLLLGKAYLKYQLNVI